MLATRQKIQALNGVIKEMLQDGVYPTLYEMFDRLSKRKKNPWGNPQVTLRPAYPNQVIGGSDGRDVERTFGEIRDDLITWYNELVGTADHTLSTFWMFEGKRDILKRRLLHLIQASEAQITSSARGGATVLKDTFNSTALVDFAKTTAELNLDGGYLTLPTLLNSLMPISLSGSTVVEERYPTTKPHGSIFDALTDAGNTGWYASLDGGTYSVTLRLPASTSAQEANGIYVNPMGPMNIALYYSNDLYNFYPVVSESIRQERSWTFAPDTVLAVRVEITGREVGLKRLKLLKTDFSERAVFESLPLLAKDIFGHAMPIDSVRLEADEECPPQTDIEYWVKPVYPNKSTAQQAAEPWVKFGDSAIWFAPSSPVTRVVAGPATVSQFVGEIPDTDNRFFVCKLGYNPIIESSRLTKGGDPEAGGVLGQMHLEYTNYSWKPLLDPNHSPVPSDWDNFGAVTKTYWRPLSLSGITSEPDPLQQEAAILVSRGCPVVEATTVSGGSETSRDWFVIGVKETDWMLAPGGNYRLSAYVYMPEDLVVTDKSCFLYNPMDKQGSGSPIIAPFRVYLNGELVADVRRAWSGDIDSADLSAFNVSYAYKAGWNRFEVLVYNKGPLEADLSDGEAIATGGVGIYIAGNPYNLVRLASGRKIQAHCTDDTRVSEFALRHLVKPGDTSSWAWTDTSPSRDLILNYDPKVSSYDTFDGHNYEQSPVLTLFLYPQNTERPTALKFGAQLLREPDAISVPKLHQYKLIINQTGV